MGKYNTRRGGKRTQRNVNASKEALSVVVGPVDEISTTIEGNKKRKASKPVECEKEAKRNKKTSNTHDKYCWKCHRMDAEIECSACPRSFHFSCVKAKINEDGSCYVCQQESIAKTSSNIDDEIHLSKLLLHIIDTACPMDKEEYKPIVNWPDSEDNEKLICKKDFRLIHDRCIQKGIQYESHIELVDDVKWIHHNCVIMYGDKSPIVKIAKKVLECINQELNDAVDCPECYCKKIGNEPLSFLSICKTPHPLVWAKVKFYPYWPAKCLRISNGKAHVRFFRTHQRADVPLSNVLAYSKEYPSNSVKKPDKKSKLSVDFVMATEELEAYVDIFQDHYGPFPFEPVNTPFDFEKEEKIMKDLVENVKHSRRRILSGDTFPSSDNEVESRPALVDLTDDASEEAENSSKTVESIISGSLLPSHHSPNSVDHQNLNWLSQPSGISISNVISGTDVPLDSSTDLLVAHCEAEPATQSSFVMSMPSAESDPFPNTSAFSQNNMSSSNSMQLALRNYNRSSETGGFGAYPPSTPLEDDTDVEIVGEISSSNVKTKINKSDTECILQTILRHDPKSFSVLKQANLLVQHLFIQFWGNLAELKSPEKIIQSQEYEIRSLKARLEEMSLMKDDYELKVKNADKVLRNVHTEMNQYKEKLKDKEEELKKVNERWEKTVRDNDKRNEEKVQEAKTFKYCNYCLKLITNKTAILCCYSGINSYAYCSEMCKDIDGNHKSECKSVQIRSKPKEREDVSAGQVAITRGISTVTVYKQSLETHSVVNEITSSNTTQQTSSANVKGYKVVSAKKTLELARNINRNQNSSDIY